MGQGVMFDEGQIHGQVASGFEQVRDVFVENFRHRGEVGAACTVFVDGRCVVDLWGGVRDVRSSLPWCEETIVPMFSTTKGIASVALALAHSRGWLSFDEAVASYWPAFAQAGKAQITVRQLLAHQAGLPAIDVPLDGILDDPAAMDAALAAQAPLWEPGQAHGYHSATLGWYEAALLRQIDPEHRSLGQFLQDEVMGPLGETFYIGLPKEVPTSEVAWLEAPSLWKMIFHLNKLPWSFVKAFLNPWSLSMRSIRNPRLLQDPKNANLRSFWELEVPAVNGVGRVHSVARIYGELACGGQALGLSQQTFDALCAPASQPAGGDVDLVLMSPMAYSLGYMKQNPTFPCFANPASFGTPGAGGSLGFADPVHRIGFAYAPNRMSFYVFGDPREAALREAVYKVVA